MSLADKLNYTIAAKLDVQKACISQGVDLPDNAPFGDYGKYIRLLSGGGGFASEYEFTCIAEENTVWCFYISGKIIAIYNTSFNINTIDFNMIVIAICYFIERSISICHKILSC